MLNIQTVGYEFSSPLKTFFCIIILAAWEQKNKINVQEKNKMGEGKKRLKLHKKLCKMHKNSIFLCFNSNNLCKVRGGGVLNAQYIPL